MDTAEAPRVVLSLNVKQGNMYGCDILQLRRKSLSNLNNVEITTFDNARSVSLVCDGLRGGEKRIDLAVALSRRLLELVDLEAGTIVTFPTSSKTPGSIVVPPTPSPNYRQLQCWLWLDSTDQIWRDVLEPGKRYQVRFSKNGGHIWCCYGERPENHGDAALQQPSLPMERGAGSMEFTVKDDPAPPRLSGILSVSSNICHLSGTPPFKFNIEFASQHEQHITISLAHTPFGDDFLWLNGVDQLVNITDFETGESVEMPQRFLCFDSNPWPDFPSDDMFVEIRPNKPYQYVLILEGEGPSSVGGLDCLQRGRKYRATLARDVLKGFGTWLYGRKEDLLEGSEKEKRDRWKVDYGRIEVDEVSEPVVFGVVE